MFPSPCQSVDPMRLAPAEAKSSQNGSFLPAGFLSLCAPQPWGPTGVPGSSPKPALPAPCQRPRSRQPPALPLVGSSGCAVPSSLSPSAGTGWGFTVVAIRQTGVSGGAGARSGFPMPGSSPSRHLQLLRAGPATLAVASPARGGNCLSQNSAYQGPRAQTFGEPCAVLLVAAVCFGLRLLCFPHASGGWVPQGGGVLYGRNKFIGGGSSP